VYKYGVLAALQAATYQVTITTAAGTAISNPVAMGKLGSGIFGGFRFIGHSGIGFSTYAPQGVLTGAFGGSAAVVGWSGVIGAGLAGFYVGSKIVEAVPVVGTFAGDAVADFFGYLVMLVLRRSQPRREATYRSSSCNIAAPRHEPAEATALTRLAVGSATCDD
jgi:hypothetical protein